jgi:hypothetical protein
MIIPLMRPRTNVPEVIARQTVPRAPCESSPTVPTSLRYCDADYFRIRLSLICQGPSTALPSGGCARLPQRVVIKVRIGLPPPPSRSERTASMVITLLVLCKPTGHQAVPRRHTTLDGTDAGGRVHEGSGPSRRRWNVVAPHRTAPCLAGQTLMRKSFAALPRVMASMSASGTSANCLSFHSSECGNDPSGWG